MFYFEYIKDFNLLLKDGLSAYIMGRTLHFVQHRPWSESTTTQTSIVICCSIDFSRKRKFWHSEKKRALLGGPNKCRGKEQIAKCM